MRSMGFMLGMMGRVNGWLLVSLSLLLLVWPLASCDVCVDGDADFEVDAVGCLALLSSLLEMVELEGLALPLDCLLLVEAAGGRSPGWGVSPKSTPCA